MGGPRTKLAAGATVLLVVLVLWRGLELSRYQPERSDAYLWGAFHVHSELSDGRGGIREIAAEAKDARVGFILLSDHGPPHREAAVLNETVHGVRVIGGSEVGVPDGHLIVSGADSVPDYHLPPFPPDAIDEARGWGALAVVTYPEDPIHRWSYWDDGFRPDGLEIINITSYFRRSSWLQKLDWGLFSLFTPYYYISALEAPGYALSRWDELSARGPVWGFYAANAHGGFPLTDDRWIGVPSYRTGLAYVGLGIAPERGDDPERAVREGAFFSVVRAAGEPQLFDVAREGDELVARVETLALTTRLVWRRDGEVFAEGPGPELRAPVGPGVFRAEVYLDDHPLLRPDVPWLLGNPLRLPDGVASGRSTRDMVARSSQGQTEPACELEAPIDPEAFAVETDEDSLGELHPAEPGVRLTYRLSLATEARVDRWVALAHRKPLDLSPYRALRIDASAPEPMRYRVELRSGDRAYYASVKVSPEARPAELPWDRFYRVSGGREPPPLASIDALFLSVSTATSRTGIEGELTLAAFGFCR